MLSYLSRTDTVRTETARSKTPSTDDRTLEESRHHYSIPYLPNLRMSLHAHRRILERGIFDREILDTLYEGYTQDTHMNRTRIIHDEVGLELVLDETEGYIITIYEKDERKLRTSHRKTVRPLPMSPAP